MTRSEAVAPLKAGEGRFPIEAGALMRGSIRRLLISAMVDFYEEKGFLESVFIVRGPVDRLRAVQKVLARAVAND